MKTIVYLIIIITINSKYAHSQKNILWYNSEKDIKIGLCKNDKYYIDLISPKSYKYGVEYGIRLSIGTYYRNANEIILKDTIGFEIRLIERNDGIKILSGYDCLKGIKYTKGINPDMCKNIESYFVKNLNKKKKQLHKIIDDYNFKTQTGIYFKNLADIDSYFLIIKPDSTFEYWAHYNRILYGHWKQEDNLILLHDSTLNFTFELLNTGKFLLGIDFIGGYFNKFYRLKRSFVEISGYSYRDFMNNPPKKPIYYY